MDYQAELLANQAEIEYKILAHVKADSHIHYNRSLAIEAMEKILDKRMTLWIQKATPHPNPTPDFDAVAFFVYRWIHNIYPLVRKELFSYARKKYTEFVPLDETLEDGHDIEEDCMQTLFYEELKKANNEFLRKLGTVDQKIYWCMLQGLSDEIKASHVFPDASYTTKVRDKVRYMTNIVEFKYACFLLTKRIYDESRILAKLNKAPKLVKRYFGLEKLDARPNDVDLLAAAFDGQLKPKAVIEDEAEWVPVSKVDFNGKAHDHWVVYKKNEQILYDHVTRSVKRVI